MPFPLSLHNKFYLEAENFESSTFCMFFDTFWGKHKTAKVNLLFLDGGLTFVTRFFMSHLKPWCVSVKKKKGSDMWLSSSRQEWITTWKQLQVGN